MLPETIEKLAEPYGLAGSVGIGIVALLSLVIAVSFAREARRKSELPDGDLEVIQRLARWVMPALLAVVAAAFAVLCATLALKPLLLRAPRDWIVAYVSVFLFGGLVGAAELISRYKDRPTRAATTSPALFYITLNALGSCAALYLIATFPGKLGFAEPAEEWNTGVLVQAVLLAGFASLLFFRTSIFKLRVGDADLAVGPSIVLDSLLSAADRAVDRVMAEPRANFVHQVMRDVAFEKAALILPSHCLALMQNVSSEETQRIVGVVDSLRANRDMPDKIKSLNLGLALVTVVGEKVLKTAIDGLREDLQDSTAQLLQKVATVMRPVSFERARRMLPQYCIALWSKPVPTDVQEKLKLDATALGAIRDVSEEYKAVILGIWLARMTDGTTLRKAVDDLGDSILTPRALPAPARSLGILAYGSLIDDPGAEIAAATDRVLQDAIRTSFAVEFARSSKTRAGAPTLVPVEAGGAPVPARIIVLKAGVSEQEAKDCLWRREVDAVGGGRNYPGDAGADAVIIDALDNFHDVDRVLVARLAPNIEPLDAERLAALALASVKAVADGALERGRDGITYLMRAKANGANTPLAAAYEDAIKRRTDAKDLEAALAKASAAADVPPGD